VTLSARTARLVALVGWTATFFWLWLGGQVPRYLGSRTAWIVPVGAFALAVASAAYAQSTADAPVARQRLALREALGVAILLAPALVSLVFAHATLGSLAASNKLSARGVDLSTLASTLSKDSRKADLLTIRVADRDPEAAAVRGLVPGRPVTLTGFALGSGSADSAKPLRLARFYITCCIADAVAFDVPVYPVRRPFTYHGDHWLQVEGVLARRRRHLVVDALNVRPVREPAMPYLPFKR
jgi:uncharacterized repeat protein (TIGR03943 family)